MLRALTVDLMRQRFPDEEPLAGGAARIRTVDRELAEELRAAAGGSEKVGSGLRFWEADWVATGQSLHYVTPRAGAVRTFQWTEIGEIKVAKRGFFKPWITMAVWLLPATSLDMEVGRSSSRALLEMADRFVGR
jgi:hypothetical protein